MCIYTPARFARLVWPHIMFTSDEVIALLSGMRALDSDYFVKLDMRDFFLSGAHGDLVDVCLLDIAAGPQKVVSDVLCFLLWHQYVQSKALPGRLWRTVRGSGMGLPHSSHLPYIYIYISCVYIRHRALRVWCDWA